MKLLLSFLSVFAVMICMMKFIHWVIILIGAGKHLDDEHKSNKK